MAKALYSNEDIITAGERLKTAAGGGPVLPWEVFQALGGRGKYDRVRDIWEGHVAARSSSPVSQTAELPAEVDVAIVGGLDKLGGSIRQLFLSHFASLAADHVRQLQIVHKQHADDLARQGRELEFWRTKATAESDLQEEPEPKKAAPRRSRSKSTADTAVTKPVSGSGKQKAAAKAKPKGPAMTKTGPLVEDYPANDNADNPTQQQLPI